MAGRPRTQHKRIVEVLARLYALLERLDELMPAQYDVHSKDDATLPMEDLGRSWRRAEGGLIGVADAFEWLEYLLAEKAKRIAAWTDVDETDNLDDETDDSVEPEEVPAASTPNAKEIELESNGTPQANVDACSLAAE